MVVEGDDDRRGRKLQITFRIITVLFVLAVAEAAAIGWLLTDEGLPGPGSDQAGPEGFGANLSQNLVQTFYPDVDFAKLYPGWSAEDIDQMQRECFAVRHVYEPFVQFKPVPVKGRFVEVTGAGYRRGTSEQPWPPRDEDLVVFVFGGSTTFGYGVRNEDTVVSALQREIAMLYPKRQVEVYNFGRGYYVSTQERILFESLLHSGAVAEIAIFIDGINEFYYPDGRPELSGTLARQVARDLPPPAPLPLATEAQRRAAVGRIVERYTHGVKSTEAIAREYGVRVIFVGQPVPFFEFERTPNRYPFSRPFPAHELCAWGYDRFAEAARSGRFGSHVVWCGDAFADTDAKPYADSVHYTPIGSQILAAAIVKRARERGLLP